LNFKQFRHRGGKPTLLQFLVLCCNAGYVLFSTAFGYVLWKREFLVYALLPFLDISRLSREWETSVKVFFDVGANVGQTSELALKTFPKARICSFEPHQMTFNG
jgi:hypothetical protein